MFPSDSKPERTYEWRVARKHGAKCVTTLSPNNVEGVTHVVGSRGRTAKVRAAEGECVSYGSDMSEQ